MKKTALTIFLMLFAQAHARTLITLVGEISINDLSTYGITVDTETVGNIINVHIGTASANMCNVKSIVASVFDTEGLPIISARLYEEKKEYRLSIDNKYIQYSRVDIECAKGTEAEKYSRYIIRLKGVR